MDIVFIDPADCVGNSLETINLNFENIGLAVSSLSAETDILGESIGVLQGDLLEVESELALKSSNVTGWVQVEWDEDDSYSYWYRIPREGMWTISPWSPIVITEEFAEDFEDDDANILVFVDDRIVLAFTEIYQQKPVFGHVYEDYIVEVFYTGTRWAFMILDAIDPSTTLYYIEADAGNEDSPIDATWSNPPDIGIGSPDFAYASYPTILQIDSENLGGFYWINNQYNVLELGTSSFSVSASTFYLSPGVHSVGINFVEESFDIQSHHLTTPSVETSAATYDIFPHARNMTVYLSEEVVININADLYFQPGDSFHFFLETSDTVSLSAYDTDGPISVINETELSAVGLNESFTLRHRRNKIWELL
jgi:hypothetical protein